MPRVPASQPTRRQSLESLATLVERDLPLMVGARKSQQLKQELHLADLAQELAIASHHLATLERAEPFLQVAPWSARGERRR